MVRLQFTLIIYSILLLEIEAQIDSSNRINHNILDEVVITAQHNPKAIEESVHYVKLISDKRIANQAAINLRDVLKMETAMRVSQDNFLGSSISMQGLSGQNVKILIDGVPVIGRLNGNIDISQINLNNIEKIEIIEGPLSVNFGTDALAGTINLISKKATLNNPIIEVNSYYETAGQYNIDYQIIKKKGPHNFHLNGGRYFFDGWNPDDLFIEFPKRTIADTNRSIQWDLKEQFFTKLGYSFKSKLIQISPYLSHFNESITNRGMPRLPYFENAFDDFYETERFNIGVNLEGKFPSGNNWKLVAAYNDFRRKKNTFYIDLTNLESQITNMESDQDTSRFGYWMSRGSVVKNLKSSKSTIEFGYDVNFEKTRGQRIIDNIQSISDFAFFSTSEINLKENLVFRPGLRASYNSDYPSPLTPSLNFKYSVFNHTIRGSYADGFRAPSLKELYFEFIDINHNIIGNKNLLAERSHNFNFSHVWKIQKSIGTISIDNSLFYNHIRNMITLAQTSGSMAYSYFNLGLFKSKGLRGDFSLKTEKFNTLVGWSFIGRFNQISTLHDISPFSFSPEYRFQGNYKFNESNSSVSVFWKYNGASPFYNLDNSGEVSMGSISSYQILDIIYIKKFNNMTLSFGGKNLFNVKNINISGQPSSGGTHNNSSGGLAMNWGRSIFISLKLNFNSCGKN